MKHAAPSIRIGTPPERVGRSQGAPGGLQSCPDNRRSPAGPAVLDRLATLTSAAWTRRLAR